MKITVVALVLVLCALVTADLEQNNDKTTEKQENNGDIGEEKNEGREEQDGMGESGSSAEIETDEGSAEFGSAESGDNEDETQPQMPAPKSMRYSGYRKPVTITPMEPMVNRQRSYRRRCFFCFPRGRLGRVELTAPGGPYLMNGFGPVNGFGMGYPDMGFPAGPGYPDMRRGYPAMGGFGGIGPCCGGPSCERPCCGGGNSNNGPMIFEGINEEEPTAPTLKVNGKPMRQANKEAPKATNKAMDPSPNKAMDQPPNKAINPSPNKAMDLPPNKVMAQSPKKVMVQTSPNQASNKIASDKPMKKLQPADNISGQSNKSKP